MHEIASGDVVGMRDASFADILDEINAKAGQMRMSTLFWWTPAGLGAFAGFISGGPGFWLCALALPGWVIGKWLDSYRRTTVLYYDLEGDAEALYNRLIQAFDDLRACDGKWHIPAGGAVQSLTIWKRNAGASVLVDRKATTLVYSLPQVIRSNLKPPALHVGKKIMFFMPDLVLVQDGHRIGAVGYTDLIIRRQNSRFIETKGVPGDATIVDHTWAHPNKNGGPDRRFKYNRQLPICLYETVHFSSESGINEVVEFSRNGIAVNFTDSCRSLAALTRQGKSEIHSLPAIDAGRVESSVEPSRRRGRLKAVMFTILAAVIGIPTLGIIFGSSSRTTDTNLSRAAVEAMPEALPTPAVEAATSSGHETVSPTIRANDSSAASTPTTPATAQIGMPRSEIATSREPEGTQVRYTQTMVNLRVGPSTRFTVIAVIDSGVAVSVVETKGGWSHVRVDDGRTGWMASSTISDMLPKQ